MENIVDGIKELKFDLECAMISMLRQMNMLHPKPTECFECKCPLVERDEETLQCPICRSSFLVKGPYLMLYCPYIPLCMGNGVIDEGRTFGSLSEWREWRLKQMTKSKE